MNKIKFFLNLTLSNTKAKIWHLLLLLTIVNIVPLFLPEHIWRDYIIFIILGWVIAYLILSRTIRTVFRLTTHDAILIERYFVFLVFTVSLIYGLMYGVRNSFDTLLTVSLWFNAILAAVVLIGIIIHLKNSNKYYHGVSKEDLIK
jgi:hypothetical protein